MPLPSEPAAPPATATVSVQGAGAEWFAGLDTLGLTLVSAVRRKTGRTLVSYSISALQTKASASRHSTYDNLRKNVHTKCAKCNQQPLNRESAVGTVASTVWANLHLQSLPSDTQQLSLAVGTSLLAIDGKV